MVGSVHALWNCRPFFSFCSTSEEVQQMQTFLFLFLTYFMLKEKSVLLFTFTLFNEDFTLHQSKCDKTNKKII